MKRDSRLKAEALSNQAASREVDGDMREVALSEGREGRVSNAGSAEREMGNTRPGASMRLAASSGHRMSASSLRHPRM